MARSSANSNQRCRPFTARLLSPERAHRSCVLVLKKETGSLRGLLVLTWVLLTCLRHLNLAFPTNSFYALFCPLLLYWNPSQISWICATCGNLVSGSVPAICHSGPRLVAGAGRAQGRKSQRRHAQCNHRRIEARRARDGPRCG